MSGSEVAGGEQVHGATNEGARGPYARWTIWKNECEDCEPECDDHWQVDAPTGRLGNTFITWAEALAWVEREVMGNDNT